MNCGAALSAAPEAAGFKLDRLIPRELLAKLESARAHGGMAGERRVITILFCDLKGSTSAAEGLDPEEWTEIMNGAFEHMIRPIYKYEGIVPRLMGDAILAFFGAPIAHEDDPQRAVLAALDIRSGADEFCGQIREKHGIDINVRIGINTGLVVVGEIGSDLRLEYTAIGDAINLAARMEQTAEPGTIQISEETHKLVAPFFDCESLGETRIKGKSAPVRTFRVLAVKRTPGQLRGVEGLSSPLVGREAELGILKARLQDLSSGEGAFVAVMGEAGLGKTSLLAETRKHVRADAPVNWLEGHALSYAQSVSYFSWRQVVRESIGARESDTPAEVRAKLQYECSCCELPGGDVAFLETMLAVESEESLKEVAGYQGEALVQRMMDVMRGYLCGLAQESPLVIVLDDLHWMDAASLNLFSILIDLVDQNLIIFKGLTRPERESAGWEFMQQARLRLNERFLQIDLEPLPPEKTNTLLVNLLGLQEMPSEVFQLIMDKAEGNPFFVEELIRSLIETKQLVRRNSHWEVTGQVTSLALPNTLTGVLGARIDRLPDESKRILQIASVIGRSFQPRVLSAMMDSAPALAGHMATLEQAGFIQPAGQAGADEEAGFMFRHVLVQDAAYESILLKQRRDLHRRAGTALESLYAERVEEFAPLLAHHFYGGGDARSLKYDTLAGDAAERLYANAEAAIHYGRALETARQVKAEPRQVADLYTKLGKALEQCGRYEEAVKTYEALRAYAHELGDGPIEMSALMALSTVYGTMTSIHNSAMAEKMLGEALELARQTGDRDTQVKLHWNLLLTYLFSKRLIQAAKHGELALELARGSENSEQLAFVLNDLSRVYTCLGRFEQARRIVQEARRLWLAMDNQAMLADSYGAEAEACFAAGEYREMFEKLSEAIQINERIDNLWGQSYNRVLKGIAHFDLGEADLAIQTANEAIKFGDQSGLLASSIAVRSDLAWTYGCYGALEKGFELATEALRVVKEKQPDWESLPRASLIRLSLLKGDLDGAKAHASACKIEPISIPYPHYTILVSLANVELAFAVEDYEKALLLTNDLLEQVIAIARPGISEVLYHKAKALVALGRLEEASQMLTEARSLAEELGIIQALWPVLFLQAKIETRKGDTGKARILEAEGEKIVNGIAQRLEAAGLRQSFLDQARAWK
jgi:predicted ATPase/class 3 adenylate cyclase